MSLDHDQETHKAIDRGSWEDAIEHAKKVPANYDIWQRLPSAHERGMPDHAINMALDELTDPYSKNKKNLNSFLFELASKLHHPSVTPETVRRVAQLGVDNGDHYVENQATHHPKFSHDTSSKDALKAAKFWRSYEIAVDPHHFAAVKSMYSGQPESAVDHRGKYGKSHGKAFIHSGVIKTDPEINSQGKFQLVSEAIPHLQGHAKKIQDKILKDDDIKKRVINGKAHVKLYRGINGNYGKSIKEAVGHNPETHEVDKKTLVLRSAPFSSWTTDHNIASNFAWHRSEIPGQEGNNGVVLSKWIPVDNILHSGTHRVIAGSDWNPHPHENEFVVGHPEGKFKISTNNLYFQPKDNVYGEGALITPKNYGEVHQAKVRKDELLWDGFDDLQKNDQREEPPTQVGQQHPTKPYVSKRHVTGETTWYYNPQASRANDNYIENNKEQYLRYFPAEHQPVVRSFIDHIANSPTRHAVVSRDQIGGQNQLRARHLKNLMSGSFDVNMKVLDPSTIHISAYRHGRGNPTHNWLYIKGKGLSEETFKSESDHDDLFKASDDWKHEGYQISHSMHIDLSSKKNPTDGDYIHIHAHSLEGKHVGNAKLYLYDKTLYPSVVDVDKKHQRKGLATAMYQHAEKVTGKKLEPGEQSIQGEALWAQKDRPFGKSEDLDKSMKHKIAALSTVASLLGVPYSTATAQQDMPKVVEQAPVTPSEDLKPISYIESRNGANQNHQKVTWGINAGSKAIGMYGFMPVEAQETIKYDPALTSKYGHLLQYHPIKEAHKIESFLLKNPNVQHEMANSHWNHLKKIFSKNKDRAVYAWKNGIKGAYEATRQEVENHPYVKEYHKYKKLLNLQKHPTAIHKPLSMKKSEDLDKTKRDMKDAAEFSAFHLAPDFAQDESPKSMRNARKYVSDYIQKLKPKATQLNTEHAFSSLNPVDNKRRPKSQYEHNPIIIGKIGKDHVLLDGHHRLINAKEKGYKTINAHIISLPKNFDSLLALEGGVGRLNKSEQEEHAFQKPHFILSAENPLYPEHQKMKMSTEELSRHLSSIGEDHEIVQGHYGNPEKSIIVKNPKDVPHLHKLASDLGQESAIYSNGHQHEMHYYHGANKGKVVHGEGTTIHQDRPSDYYTTMHQNGQPVHFTHHFDFDKSEDLNKSKNVREQRKKVFGTRANPSLGSPMREKHIEHINNFAKKFLNLEIQPSGGKIDAKTGQRRSADPKVGIDKPDWRSGQLESQWNPEAIIHELAHLMLLPPGVGLAEGQRLMDKTYGDLQSKYGYQQQKRAQAEVQPMAAEQIIRRHLGLPASRVNIPVESKDAPQRVSVEDPNIVIATRVPQKTRSGETKYIDLIRQSKFLHPENKQRLEDIFSGKLTFHPEAGWLPKKSDSIPKDHTESLQGGPQKLVANEQEDLEKAPLHYDIDDTDSVAMTPYSSINKLVARNKFKEGEHRVYVNPKDSTDFVHTLHIPGVRGPVAQLHVQERYQDDIGETEPTVSHSVVSPKHKGHGYGKFLYRQAIKHHKILTSDQTVSGRANKMWNKLHNKDIATDIAEFGDDPTPHRAMYIGKSEELEKAISPEEAEQQGYKLKHLTTAHGHLAGAKLYHKGEVVGHIHYSPQSNKEGYHKILNSDIEPEHRGKGLYQYMIQSIHDKVKSEGARGVMSEGYQRSSDATNAWEKIATHKKDSGHPVYVGIKQPDGSYKNELRHKPVIDYYLGKSEGDVLYHYSQHSEPLNLIHPEKQGEGMAGQEKKRVGRIPRSYYYDTPDNHESIVTQGAKHMYTVKHPGKILDVASPEALHVKEKARNPYGIVEPDALEEQVKAHGYHGYKNSASSNPNIVAVFKPLEVHSSTKLIKSDNSEYESESLMKAEFDPAEDVHSFTATNGSEEDMNESYKIDQFLKDDKTHKLQHKGLFTHDSFIAGTSPEDAWLIKVESGTVPGIQAIKHTGPQPVKEAAFYHIAKDIFGLGKFIPRAILGTIEKGSERKWAAAIKMLPPQYKLAAPMDSEHHGAIKGILQKYNLSGVTHMLAFLLYVLGDLDSHGNNYMTDGHEIRLIDHGSSFANEKSEDRSDKKMFIPYILRRDGYKHGMSNNEKLSHMPTIPTIDVAHKLKNYILSIDPQKLYQQIKEFGLDPKASVARLRVVQHMVRLSEHPDNVINFLWVKGSPSDLFDKYLKEHE